MIVVFPKRVLEEVDGETALVAMVYLGALTLNFIQGQLLCACHMGLL